LDGFVKEKDKASPGNPTTTTTTTSEPRRRHGEREHAGKVEAEGTGGKVPKTEHRRGVEADVKGTNEGYKK
jgi:hypothetical protein